MRPWTGRRPRMRCRRPSSPSRIDSRSRRSLRHPVPGATATTRATAASCRSATLDLERGGVAARPSRSPTRPGASSNAAGDNAVLVLHALTGDSHLVGPAGPGHPTAGWWSGVVGAGQDARPRPLVRRRAQHARRLPGLDRARHRSRPTAPSGAPASRTSPSATRCAAQRAVIDRARHPQLGRSSSAARWAGCRCSSGAISHPDRVERIAVLAAPPATERRPDRAQLGADRGDPHRTPPSRGGDYYDAEDGEGPHRGLALARRMALLNYRSPIELNDRFERSWQSGVDPARRRRACSPSRATSASTATSSPAASTPTATSRSWTR